MKDKKKVICNIKIENGKERASQTRRTSNISTVPISTLGGSKQGDIDLERAGSQA